MFDPLHPRAILRRPIGNFFPSVLLGLVGILLSASMAACADPSASVSTTTGSIRGKVIYESDSQNPWRLGRYYIRDRKSGELAEAVVAISHRRLKSPDDGHAMSTVIVDQKNFQFVPETVAIRAGDRIRFLNSDDHVHNVRTSHRNQSFNVNMPAGASHNETFRSASGIRQPYRIECVYHSAMRAWVFVFDHPWFALTGKDGAFELKDVLPGDYRLDVVHPAGDLRATERVQVVAGKVNEVVIRLRHSPEQSVSK